MLYSITKERAAAFLDTLPPAVAGQRGHTALFRAATELVNGFELRDEDAFELLVTQYNPRCQPAWSESEIWHKIESAKQSRRSHGWRRHWRPCGGVRLLVPVAAVRPKATQPAKPKAVTRFFVEGGPDRWLEHPPLLQRVTWPNGGQSERRFVWDGFQWNREQLCSETGKVERESLFDWSDGLGSMRHLVHRVEFRKQPGETKRRKSTPVYHWSSSERCFVSGEGDWPRVPFLAVELKEARWVYVCEGETSALAMLRRIHAKGLAPSATATTTGGSKSWRPELVTWFVGKAVRILPDADDSGWEYARAVLRSLQVAGVVATILPAFDGMGAGFDAADWFAAVEELP